MQSSVPPSGPLSLISDVLPWALPAISGLIGFSAARYTAFAQLNRTVLDASRSLLQDSQALHSRDSARILELEAEVLRQRGEIAQHIQREQSLQRQIDRVIGGTTQ